MIYDNKLKFLVYIQVLGIKQRLQQSLDCDVIGGESFMQI